jgi:hypothetical protein
MDVVTLSLCAKQTEQTESVSTDTRAAKRKVDNVDADNADAKRRGTIDSAC